jgi:hypothetical protein
MTPQRRRKGLFKALKAYKMMFPDNFDMTELEKKKQIRRLFKTRKCCSCSMCGNPRHHFKHAITRQEQLNLIKYQEELNDIFKSA